MNVTIRPELQAFIEGKIRSGVYTSTDEAVNELLRYLSEVERLEDTEELRKQVLIGVEAADRGQVMDWDPEEIWQEVERRAAEDQKKAG
jgi:antitoxin ParD1/3/4